MSGAFDGPIALTIGRSFQLLVIIIVSHLVTLAVLLMIPAERPWLWLCGALIIVSCGCALARFLRPSDTAIVSVLWRRDNRWQLGRRDGVQCAANLRRVFPLGVGLTVLRFDLADGGTEEVALLADNVNPDQFRRLRVRLRLAAAAI